MKPQAAAARLHCFLSHDVLYNQVVEAHEMIDPPHPASSRLGEALTRELNPRQVEAVTYQAQPLLAIAGAGSGKTRVITCRLARFMAEGAMRRASIPIGWHWQ